MDFRKIYREEIGIELNKDFALYDYTVWLERRLEQNESVNGNQLEPPFKQLPITKDELTNFVGEWQNNWCHNNDEIIRTDELADAIYEELRRRQSA